MRVIMALRRRRSYLCLEIWYYAVFSSSSTVAFEVKYVNQKVRVNLDFSGRAFSVALFAGFLAHGIILSLVTGGMHLSPSASDGSDVFRR